MKHNILSTLLLLAGAVALPTTGAAAQPLLRGDGRVVVTASHGEIAAPAPAAPDEMMAVAAVATADSLVGARYRFGGQSPTRGFDCSGFVRYVYAAHGVELPRTAHQMAGAGIPVARDAGTLRAGDLLLFRLKKRGRVDHVAMYAGSGRIVHAASRRRRYVRYDDLDSDRGRYYLSHLVTVRRVIEAPPPAFAATAAGQAHYKSWSGSVPRP